MGQIETEFETLESAHDFVKLLAKTVAETRRELEGDVFRESVPSRRMDALRLAQYDLGKLEAHLIRSSRILNDLRTLRRLLFEERESRKKYIASATHLVPVAMGSPGPGGNEVEQSATFPRAAAA